MNPVSSPPGLPQPRFLVLLASHNGAAHIKDQLASILSQREVHVEIHVGDDASVDNTVAIAQSMGSTDKIHIHRRAKGSGSAAGNFVQLIRETEASGFDYVAFSDQDDIWMEGKLLRAAQELSTSGAGGYSSSVVAQWPDGAKSIYRQSASLRNADFLFEGAGQGCTFVLTQEFFRKVQEVFRSKPHLMAGLIYHDWAVYAVARSLGVHWRFDAQPTLWYRQHGGNHTGARFSVSGISTRLRMICDGRYRKQMIVVTRLCQELGEKWAQEWAVLDAGDRWITYRFEKAIFCLRHGRRRAADRVVTAIAALVGWI
jgi:rhamnosyltransferase